MLDCHILKASHNDDLAIECLYRHCEALAEAINRQRILYN